MYEKTLAALRAGFAAVVPTDTVAGLACAVLYASGPEELCALKGRSLDKPIAWLVGSTQDLCVFGRDIYNYTLQLATHFWPGPLTLVVNAAESAPLSFQSRERTIALRMPAHELVLSLIRDLRSPLACTSANFAGKRAVARVSDVDAELLAEVAAVCADDALSNAGGLASTVCDCTALTPKILREGELSLADLMRVLN